MKRSFKFIVCCFGFYAFLQCAQSEDVRDKPDDPLTDRLGVLLDISPEMGHLIPQARKEIAILNEELKKGGRSPVALIEMEGSALGKPGALDAPASKNAVVQIEQLFETSQVNGVLWITAMKSFHGEGAFTALDKVMSVEPQIGEKPRQLMIHHIWPEEMYAGPDWRGEKGSPKDDPLHPKAYPGEWIEPVAKSKGYIFRKWRELPPLVASLAANPDFPNWKMDLEKRYGLHFIQPREKWSFRADYGKKLISNTTLIPFLDPKTVKERHERVFTELCRRRSIEEDLNMIQAERLGVFLGFGYLRKDFDLAKTSADPERHEGTAAIVAIDKISKEFRENQRSNEGNPTRFYHSEILDVQKLDKSRIQTQNEGFARQAAKMIHDHNLEAIYVMTNGFTEGNYCGKFTMSLEPLAAYLKESGARLYVRVPFELGVAPYKLSQLAVASGGAVFFGPGEENDLDFRISFPEGRWPQGN